MAPKPLEILKKGLSKISKQIKDRKDKLNLKLSRRETISSVDEECRCNRSTWEHWHKWWWWCRWWHSPRASSNLAWCPGPQGSFNYL